MKNFSKFITTDDDWRIVAALRGPDDASGAAQGCKLITTAVVRYLAGFRLLPGKDFGAFGQFTVSPAAAVECFSCLPKERQDECARWLRNNRYGHFGGHLFAALGRLGPDGEAHCDWLTSIISVYAPPSQAP